MIDLAKVAAPGLDITVDKQGLLPGNFGVPVQPKPTGPVPQGEATKNQFNLFSSGLVVGSGYPFGSGTWPGGYNGWGQIGLNQCGVPLGTYYNYELMGRNPTVALCTAAANAPICSATMGFEGSVGAEKKIGAARLADLVEEVASELMPLSQPVREYSPSSRQYGNFVAELVWKTSPRANGNGYRTTVDKFKPLLQAGPWALAGFSAGMGYNAGGIVGTEAIIDNRGELVGIQNQGDEIHDMRRVYWLAYDSRGFNPYGRSVRENFKKPWLRQEQLYDLLESGMNIMVRSVPYIEYPFGMVDQNGNSLNAAALANAQTLAQQIVQGQTAVVPNPFAQFIEKIVQAGGKISDMMPYKVDFIDSKNDSAQGIATLWDRFDNAICMGHLVPPRAILQARTASKADSETHGGVSVQIQEPFGEKICVEFNKIIDTYLEQNYGPEYVGLVVCKVSPMQDSQLNLQQDILKALFSGPQGPLMFLRCVDALSVMSKTGVKPANNFDAAKIADDFMAQQQKSREVNAGEPKKLSLSEDEDKEKKKHRDDWILLLMLLFDEQTEHFKMYKALPADSDSRLALILGKAAPETEAVINDASLSGDVAANTILEARKRLNSILLDQAAEINATTLKNLTAGTKPDWIRSRDRASNDVDDAAWIAGSVGEVAAGKALGKKLVWRTAGDEKVCPTCDALDGTEIVSLDAGPLPIVDSHNLCRCEIVEESI